MNIRIKAAQQNDMDWVNRIYETIGFPPSVFENELIAIAEVDSQNVGLGRVIRIDEEQAEMGGMYVLDDFREKGIASKIIRFLLENSIGYERIYCLLFENLKEYYGKFGFATVPKEDYSTVPEKVLKKHEWCNQEFENPVLLLSLEK